MAQHIKALVEHKQASDNTKYHALYLYFFCGYSKIKVASVFRKNASTIGRWIDRYEDSGSVERIKHSDLFRKFGHEKRQFIVDLINDKPLMFLEEIKQEFIKAFSMDISISQVYKIMHAHGLTHKVIERRAMQIRNADVARFFNDLQVIDWSIFNIVFLDEVSFDNRTMLRNKGWKMKGSKLVVKGEFVRKPRVSLLCFLNVFGLQEAYLTDGTFDRTKFLTYCSEFALKSGKVYQYPKTNSIWIMDGARIHCHPDIVNYLRSLGIVVIFLPAYCPMFNPIEVLFGLVKRRFRARYSEGDSVPLPVVVSESLLHFRSYDFSSIFRHCGYSGSLFNPGTVIDQATADSDSDDDDNAPD